MIDIYNSLLQLARERVVDLNLTDSNLTARMPSREELVDALARVNRGEVVDITADPILRRALVRMLAVNQIVQADALLERWEPEMVLVGAGVQWEAPPPTPAWARSNSGEMVCPECGYGSLCYLVGNEGGAFVECSTVNCLYWDARL